MYWLTICHRVNTHEVPLKPRNRTYQPSDGPIMPSPSPTKVTTILPFTLTSNSPSTHVTPILQFALACFLTVCKQNPTSWLLYSYIRLWDSPMFAQLAGLLRLFSRILWHECTNLFVYLFYCVVSSSGLLKFLLLWMSILDAHLSGFVLHNTEQK